MSKGTNAGGVNVMTYDLSNNQQYHECPDDKTCSLSQQVNYYMKSYADNGMQAYVGYEIGIPAYPDKNHDPTHQLPLTQAELTSILAVQGKNGGFFWELFKPAGAAGNVDASYNGRVYTAQWWSQNNVPSAGAPWVDNGPCTSATSTSAPTTPTAGACSGASAWSSSTAYSAGSKVSYGGFIYTAQWWTQGETPGSAAAWAKGPACSGTLRRRLYQI
ncbi:hypothetical protein BGZ65_001700 [Modicella reniformis]|uniref:Chitin-binding type-3 domain-containing protein n=1 Tax=Modicella reniformis TaxID=1440133 RepID=A0A9P6MIV0_9FUNG|nr:hypothetical protein BGZ65_001700 [Modicella reniformis]